MIVRVTLTWLYSDELTPATQQVFDRVVADGAWVPSLWRLEVASSLQGEVRLAALARRCRMVMPLNALLLQIIAPSDDMGRGDFAKMHLTA